MGGHELDKEAAYKRLRGRRALLRRRRRGTTMADVVPSSFFTQQQGTVPTSTAVAQHRLHYLDGGGGEKPVDPERTRPGNDMPYETHHTPFDRRIVVVTAALLVLLVGLLLLHCLVRCLLRRLHHPRSPEAPAHHPPMKDRQIRALPSFTFRSEATPPPPLPPPHCLICLADFADADLIRVLPSCRHSFHAACLDKWLHRQATCPTCRADLLHGPQTQTVRRPFLQVVHVLITPTPTAAVGELPKQLNQPPDVIAPSPSSSTNQSATP